MKITIIDNTTGLPADIEAVRSEPWCDADDLSDDGFGCMGFAVDTKGRVIIFSGLDAVGDYMYTPQGRFTPVLSSRTD